MRLPYGTVCEVLWAQDVALTVCKCTPEEVYDQCVEGIIGMTRNQSRSDIKDTNQQQHFRNRTFVALKRKFISISPNLGAQCVQLDQSDCLLDQPMKSDQSYCLFCKYFEHFG